MRASVPVPAPGLDAAIDDLRRQAAFTTWAAGADGVPTAQSHFRLGGLWCAACAGWIEDALRREAGVLDAHVDYAGQRAAVRWDPAATRPSRIVCALRAAGYDAAPDAAEPARALRRREARAALWRLFVAGFCMMQVMMVAVPAYVATPGTLAPDLLRLLHWAGWLLSLPVLLFSAAPLFRDAWSGLRQRRIRMELPSAIAVAVIFAASTAATFGPESVFGSEVWFDSFAMFVFFLLAARWLALRARHRVAGALEDALERLPAAVRHIGDDGAVTWVAPEALVAGDRVRVLAGEAFAADGPLLEGRTHVDEALLTGESRPVAKAPGDTAVAGSVNLDAPVLQRVERLGAETRFAAVVALMRGAFAERPPLVQAADRFAQPFLGGVLLLAAAAGAVWWRIDPSRALWVAVSVLVVTCPCALSLAAPSALLAAAGALARRGVLVQRLGALEALAGIDRLFFDKTGTLTGGHPTLRAVRPAPGAWRRGLDAAAVLRLAASLAALSAHPLSRALTAASEDAVPGSGSGVGDPGWSAVEEIAGRGVQARAADGTWFRLGSAAWVGAGDGGDGDADAASVAFGSVGAGAAPDAAAHADLLACFAFDEALRPDAFEAVAALRGAGVRLGVLSGDAPERVARIARSLGIDDAEGGATPEAKLARLAAAQGAGERVGMVGDGLNDAPVIARADVSFAFAAGSAIAQSKADFILLSGRLGAVAEARATARRAMRIVRQNLAWAALYNLACVPLALLDFFPPWAAGLGMAASSLAVVGNALRVGAPLRRSVDDGR